MLDGRVCPPKEQTISVFDRGFLYGDSVFETLRTYSGAPFALDQHLARLARSAELVFIPLSIPLPELAKEVLKAVRVAENAESYVRLMLTRGQGALGLDPALAQRPSRVIIVAPLSVPPAHVYETGVAAITHHTQRAVDGTNAVGAKIGNYLVNVLAMREAGQANAVEALIVDAEGRLLEGASSNVFLVKEGQLITAPVHAGILAGITRAHVLTLAEGQGMAVQLRSPALKEAREADEIFITSSIRELVPIVRLDGQPVGKGNPGPVYQGLLQAFRARVGSLQSN
jgi:branched-chain amino acid aminotransferase